MLLRVHLQPGADHPVCMAKNQGGGNLFVDKMPNNYQQIVQANLKKLYNPLPDNLAEALPANQSGSCFTFEAFGEQCQIRPDGIHLGNTAESGVRGILITLYALHATPEPEKLEPLKSFKDFPNSMPYSGAFVTHTERILIPQVEKIEKAQTRITAKLQGRDATELAGGDFSFLVRPLPKISLCYIFYRADEEFPASITCLYSSNASTFLPIDALADVGEYTSRTILTILV
jgi:hypothetical protein